MVFETLQLVDYEYTGRLNQESYFAARSNTEHSSLKPAGQRFLQREIKTDLSVLSKEDHGQNPSMYASLAPLQHANKSILR